MNMKVSHLFRTHAICPFVTHKRVWDYYTVEVTLNRVVDVHKIEEVISDNAGLPLSQEALGHLLAVKLKVFGPMTVEVDGGHSATSDTLVRFEITPDGDFSDEVH